MFALHPSTASVLSTLVADDARQPDDQLGHEGDEQKNDDCRGDEGGGFADDGGERLLGHVRQDEQQQPVRRRQEADHDVDDHHHAEMHEIDAQRPGARNQDRDDDEQDGAALEDASEDEQDGVDEQQELDLGQLEAADEVLERGRNILDRHHIIED